MSWQVKTLDELTPRQLHAIYQTRVAVFVVEQNCPYPEVDEYDLNAMHLFQEDNGSIKAYCRLIPTDNTIKLGRVLVTEVYRGTGLGRKLINQALSTCQQHFPNQTIYAQAQAHLKDFYASFGFKAISKEYLEDGIPHVDMTLTA